MGVQDETKRGPVINIFRFYNAAIAVRARSIHNADISFDFVQRTLSGKRIPATPPTRPHLQHGGTCLQCRSPAEQVPCLTSLTWSVCPGVPT